MPNGPMLPMAMRMLSLAPPISSVSILSAIALGLSPSPAFACSKIPSWGHVRMHASTMFMTGAATRDTLHAGPGAVEFGVSEGHFGNSGAKPVFGQVLSVTALGRRTPSGVRRAVAASGNRVLLVPWDYGPDCRAVQWSGSARWLADTASGFFSAGLRDETHWVNGIPTLDVHAPQFLPYPAAVTRRGVLPRRPLAADSMLTASQLLELTDEMPTHEDLLKRLDTAAVSLRAWIASRPELATLYPIPETLAGINWTVSHTMLTRRPVPLAGTYRVTLTLGDKDSLTYYARTSEHPTSVLRLARPLAGPATQSGDTSATGVYVLSCAARTVAQFSARQPCYPGQKQVSQGYFAFADSVSSDRAGTEERQGSIDLLGAASSWKEIFDGDTTSVDFLQRAAAISAAAKPRTYTPGRFRKTRDGRVTYERTVLNAGKVALRVRAERISVEAFSGG